MRKITMEYEEYFEDLTAREKLGFKRAIESILAIDTTNDNDEKFSKVLKISTDLKLIDCKTFQLAKMVGLEQDYIREKLYPQRSNKQ